MDARGVGGGGVGFEFAKRPTVEVCGKLYEVDLADVGFVEAVMTDFSGITREYEVLTALKQKLTAEAETITEQRAAELGKELSASNRRLFDSGIAFVSHVLGEEAKDEIFASRRANSADVVELCAFLYKSALTSREEVVNRYVLPNREQRRRPAKVPAGGRKKGAGQD